MDSQPMTDEALIDLIDIEWRNDKLPNEDILLPLDKLPDPEDCEHQTMKEVEDKWLDLAIMTRHSDDTLNISNS